jgi:hypothetical protein
LISNQTTIRRFVSAVAFAFALLFVASGELLAQVIRVTRNVNLRQTPSTELAPMRLLAVGTLLIPLDTEQTNEYYPVLTGEGEEGWVWSRNVQFEAEVVEIPAYRRANWRHWIDADRDCQNTRTEVLIRQSRQPVRFSTRADGRQCAVVMGLWVDPYGGDTIRDPRQLDVDHVVPLQNAHLSGGWRWDPERRQDYANFLADTLHLLAVRNSLNRQKGAKSPDQWMPPDIRFSCAYIIAWEAIKQRWQLDMTVRERAALDSVRSARACPN